MATKFTCVKETCIYAEDLAAMKDFYHHKLELPIVSEKEGRHLFFRVGTSMFLCFNPRATKNEDFLPPHYGSGRIHYAFEVKPEDYDDWKQKLKSENIPIEKEVSWKNRKSLYFYDPAHNVGEIVMAGIWDNKQQ